MTAREVCLLLVLDVIELVEQKGLDVIAAGEELGRRAAADGRPMKPWVAEWVVEFVQRARDCDGLDPTETAREFFQRGLPLAPSG